jgi:hypothetical protein
LERLAAEGSGAGRAGPGATARGGPRGGRWHPRLIVKGNPWYFLNRRQYRESWRILAEWAAIGHLVNGGAAFPLMRVAVDACSGKIK